jgi:hypothetical protein
MTIQKKIEDCGRQPSSQKTTEMCEDNNNLSTSKKLLRFSPKVINNNNNSKKKTKHLECNCWVCKILDSLSEADTLKYEAYNIVSETGDSIFYDPLISSSIFHNDDQLVEEAGQQIYIAEDIIRDIVQQDENKLTKHFNGVNFNKNEY